jgi:NAD(P)-dependent dehydrogenase (short-subunit alcohol dehydrogenase family)
MASWAILNYADYNAAKAGVIELTKSMALELAPKIRVNAIAAVVSGERCVFLHDRVSARVDGGALAGSM